MLRALSKPIRIIFRWQVLVTAAIALPSGFFAGAHGVWSAVLGGVVSIFGGLASAAMLSKSGAQSGGGVLLTAVMAEGIRVGLIVVLLWIVLATYREVVVLAFLGSFIATVLLFAMAFFVREY